MLNFVRCGRSQGTHIGVPTDEVLEDDGDDVRTGAMQQHLGDQHLERIARTSPGEVSPVPVEPREHLSAHPRCIRQTSMVRAVPGLTVTHKRILDYLTSRVGQNVPGREIAEVAGIAEWARRIRELRVEHGYEITVVRKGRDSTYRLESPTPDLEQAVRWRLMNRVRRDPEHGARDRILAFLKANVGKTVTMDELRYVANIHEVGRRIRELRVEHGYLITSHLDRTGLRPGEYVLEALDPLPANERLSAEQRTRILERDGYRCRRCGWSVVDPPTHGKRFVEVHHRIAVAHGGGSEDENLETLCNVCHDAIPAPSRDRSDL